MGQHRGVTVSQHKKGKRPRFTSKAGYRNTVKQKGMLFYKIPFPFFKQICFRPVRHIRCDVFSSKMSKQKKGEYAGESRREQDSARSEDTFFSYGLFNKKIGQAGERENSAEYRKKFPCTGHGFQTCLPEEDQKRPVIQIQRVGNEANPRHHSAGQDPARPCLFRGSSAIYAKSCADTGQKRPQAGEGFLRHPAKPEYAEKNNSQPEKITPWSKKSFPVMFDKGQR